MSFKTKNIFVEMGVFPLYYIANFKYITEQGGYDT